MFDEEERDGSIIELGIFVTQPPEVVWRALTEPELFDQWFTRSTGLTAETGSTFILEIASTPPGEVSCEVTAAEPGSRFAHSYVDLRGKPPQRWYVDWRLVPQGRGTRVLLAFGGFDIDDRRQKFARNGIERGLRTTLLPQLEWFVATM